jgi:hypothetical protein
MSQATTSHPSLEPGQSTVSSGEGHWAVAVVHGIGNTEPIALMKEIITTLQHKDVRPELEVAEATEVYDKLPELLADSRGQALEEEFAKQLGLKSELEDTPQHMRRGTIGQSEVQFATAHWSDISFNREGFVNLYASMAMTGFGVRYLADVACRQSDLIAQSIRFVLRAMVKWMALFILPVTLFSLIFSSMGLIGFTVFLRHMLPAQAAFIAVSSLAIALIISFFGIREVLPIRKERTLAVPIFIALVVVAVISSCLLMIGKYGPVLEQAQHWDPKKGEHVLQRADFVSMTLREWMFWYGERINHTIWTARIRTLDEIGVYFGFLHYLQLWGGIVMILMTGIVILLLGIFLLTHRHNQEARRSVVVASIAVISLWIFLIMVFWPENVLTNAAMSNYAEGQSYWKDFYKLVLIYLPGLELSGAQFRYYWPGEQRLSHDASLSAYFGLLWFEWVFLAFLMCLTAIAISLLVRRKVWGYRHKHANLADFVPTSSGSPAKRAPRLIVPKIYIQVVLCFMAIVAFVALAHALKLDAEMLRLVGAQYLIADMENANPPHEISVRSEYIRLLVILALLAFVFGAHYVRFALKLMLDVVNHFTAPGKNSTPVEQRFPVRRRIERRLQRAIEFLLRDPRDMRRHRTDKPHMLVIAHSQGTVIALEELFGDLDRKGVWEEGGGGLPPLSERVTSLTVLTFGSPLTNVYQHYFAHLYPPLATTRLAGIASDPRVLWINAYRIDDYVGTYIDNTIPNFPINVPLPVGGHTDYWKPAVFAEIFGLEVMRHVLAVTARPLRTDSPPRPAPIPG